MICKNKLNNINLNNKIKYFIFNFKYFKCGSWIVDDNLKQKTNCSNMAYESLKQKLTHTNAFFIGAVKKKSGIFQEIVALLSFTQHPKPLNDEQIFLGLNKLGKRQYLNNNHPLISNRYLFGLLFKEVTKEKKKLQERAEEMNDIFINSGEIENVEDRLNRGTQTFNYCMEKYHNVQGCYDMIYITYSKESEIIFKIFLMANGII